MRVPLLWLADYLDLTADAGAIAEKLTMAGIEVAAVETRGAHWGEQIFVGRVVAIAPHPNADRLVLATVDYGAGEIRVVTGASNFAVGDRVPIALAGAQLYNAYKPDRPLEELKPTKLRGVESSGMICSEAELGLSDEHSGIMLLPADAPVGDRLVNYLGGQAIELDLKPDRADCLAMLGVARYVAGLLDQPFKPPAVPTTDSQLAPPPLEVVIQDPADCPRYSVGYLQDVVIGPSPAWLAQRLEAAGQRPINNIVDITNFVMLEYGQPLHAFDNDRLRGHQIMVRRAAPGEKLLTLDRVERELAPTDLVIADSQGPVGLAGVMGGLNSEITGETRTILLESANFAAPRIRATARRLGLPSEAAKRFENRISPETTVPALQRAIALAEAIGAGRGLSLWTDSYPIPQQRRTIDFDLDQIRRLLGVNYPRAQVASALTRAGFAVTDNGADLAVTVPYFRGDVKGSADLVEEVAAMIGFDTIPATLPDGGMADQVPLEYDSRRELARAAMVSAGYREAITYVLTSPAELAKLNPESGGPACELGSRLADLLMPWPMEPLAVHNPLRSAESVLKTATLPHLLQALAANLRYAAADVALFELGTIYVPRAGQLPDERSLVSAVLSGSAAIPAWQGNRPNSFFDMKGTAEVLLSRMGVKARFEAAAHPAFAPGRLAVISAGDEVIGAVGQLDPGVLDGFDIAEPAFALLASLDKLLQHSDGPAQYVNLPRYPAVLRDISIVIDPIHPSAAVEALIRSAAGPLVDGVRLVDEYSGEQVPPGMRGLTYAISYRDDSRTLTEKAIERPHRGVVKALRGKFGARLRSDTG